MRVISKKALRLFWASRPVSKPALMRWYKVVTHTEFKSFDELRQTFPSADKVGHLVVFNIGGNQYRLIASIHFNRAILYVRYVLTHREYDKGEWKS